MPRVSGPFDVTVKPLDAYAKDDSPSLGRLSLDKQYHGDLDGTAKGEMLTAGTNTRGSAVYVAIERFSGTLGGRRGTFMLHHRGIMDRGASDLSISIVPDSGTEELTGIAGTLSIEIADKKHFYALEYSLPPSSDAG